MSDNSDNSEYESDDDEDYIPENSASEEEEEFGKKKTNRKRNITKNKPVRSSKRKRRGGIQLEEDEDDEEEEDEDVPLDDESEEDVVSEEEDEEDEEVEEEEKEKKEKEVKEGGKEEKPKSRVDDLWEEFKKDTAGLPSSKKGIMSDDNKEVKNKPSSDQTETSSKETSKKVEVTEIYDFAGEEVKVVKSVDASSLQTSSKNNTEESTEVNKPKPQVIKKKPSGGLGNVLGKLSKKPKLSTLEKSKLDWNQFKKQEGIEDELKTSNKDGYLEKTAFLSRVDHKQFEIERDIRQGVRKK